MELTRGGARLVLLQGDITVQAVDAVVNAANSGLMGGGGVDGAIHRAGGPSIKEQCRAIVDRRGRLPAGRAVWTTAGAMTARWVIHTVGPVWRGGGEGEAETLASAYRASLAVARELGARTVAFPSISTGAYGFPVGRAAAVALGAVSEELDAYPGSIDEVRIVLFDRGTLQAYEDAMTGMGGA